MQNERALPNVTQTRPRRTTTDSLRHSGGDVKTSAARSTEHHNVSHYLPTIIHYNEDKKRIPIAYGVRAAMRVLSPQAILKKHEQIRQFLRGPLGFTTAQREVVFRLLRLWSYYGTIYPKEKQITNDPGCGKTTFFATLALLKEMHLITVINRYVKREHAQISNLYQLDKLIYAIAKFLAERGHQFKEWLRPIFDMDWPSFWTVPWPGHTTPGGSLAPEGVPHGS